MLIASHWIERFRSRFVRGKESTFKIQWEFKGETTELCKARENAGDQIVIGVIFNLIVSESGMSFLEQSR